MMTMTQADANYMKRNFISIVYIFDEAIWI